MVQNPLEYPWRMDSHQQTLDDHDDAGSAQLQLQDLATTATLLTPAHSADTSAPTETASVPSDSLAGVDDEDDGDSTGDPKRNWTPDLTLRLVVIWKRICHERPDIGRVARLELVYDELKQVVDCSHRSRKAVEDKLYTLKQMYQFIVKMNGNLHKANQRADVPTWFGLTKDERRAIRSLHRIRVPNISFDVFKVIDTVLNPTSPYKNEDQQPSNANVRLFSGSEAGPTPATSVFSVDVPEVLDNKRNWSEEVTLQLAKAWRSAYLGGVELRGAMLTQSVYNEFIKVVGGCSRSKKAIEDKMHAMKEMYRFIQSQDSGCGPGSAKVPWFTLTKQERRQLRSVHKIRVPNLSLAVFQELDQFLKQSDLSEVHTGPVPMLNVDQGRDPAQISTLPNTGDVQSVVFTPQPVIEYNDPVMRRLALEESQLSPAPITNINADHQQGLQLLLQQTIGGIQGERDEPSAKRARVSTNETGTNDQRLDYLIRLQEQAILEKRQHHQAQIAILREILQHVQTHNTM